MKELRSLSATFAILDEFERRGILHFHREKGSSPIGGSGDRGSSGSSPIGGSWERGSSSSSPIGGSGERGSGGSGSLLVEETLATLKLAEGADGFKHFLTQVAMWQNSKLLQDAYETLRIDTEARAVREAKKQYANLTKADIQRIRQNARDNMSELDISKIPSLFGEGGAEFDIFVIRATAPSAEAALNEIGSSPNGESGENTQGALLALGHWDGKTLEMAMYDDIKQSLTAKSSNR